MNSKRLKPRGLRTALGILAIGLANTVAAQTRPPDAGTILRETDPAQRPTTPANTIGEPSEARAPRSADAVRVRVTAVRITGATRYRDSELQAIVSDLLGREVDYLELRRAADKITQRYRADGWFARAYLPEQSLDDGVLTIAVIEARVGAVRIEAPPGGSLVGEDTIRDMLLARQDADGALAIVALERAALLVDELPAISAAVVLAPGANAGETDIIARIDNTARLRGHLEADNSGIASTGRERIIARAMLASPLRLGDELAALLNLSSGNQFVRLGYDLPIGADGWRVGVGASALEYELGGEFKALDAHGCAQTWSMTGTYPLARGNRFNVRLVSGYEERRYENFALDVQTSHSLVRALRGGLTFDRLDSLGGGGLMQYGVQLTSGSTDLSANAADFALDAATVRSDGDYLKLAWSIARLQRLGDRDRLSISVAGQAASRNLDSSERLSLGGASGVRAYPELEASGDEGWIASAEWTRTLPHDWSVSLFYDLGLITQHKRTWTDWSAGHPGLRNRYTLDGAGASLSWSSLSGLEVRATAATRFGENPAADPLTAHDADGSQNEPQLWVTARWSL